MSIVVPFVLTNKDPLISNLEYQKMKFLIEDVCGSLKRKHSIQTDAYVAIMSLLSTPWYVRKGRKGMADPIYAINVVLRKEPSTLEHSAIGDFHWGYSYTYWLSADLGDLTLMTRRRYRIFLAKEAELAVAKQQRLRELREEIFFNAAMSKLQDLFGAKPEGGKENGR